jgi:hypothetical protein
MAINYGTGPLVDKNAVNHIQFNRPAVGAIKAYDEALRIDPNYALSRNHRAVFSKTLKDSEANAAFAKDKELGHKAQLKAVCVTCYSFHLFSISIKP